MERATVLDKERQRVQWGRPAWAVFAGGLIILHERGGGHGSRQGDGEVNGASVKKGGRKASSGRGVGGEGKKGQGGGRASAECPHPKRDARVSEGLGEKGGKTGKGAGIQRSMKSRVKEGGRDEGKRGRSEEKKRSETRKGSKEIQLGSDGKVTTRVKSEV